MSPNDLIVNGFTAQIATLALIAAVMLGYLLLVRRLGAPRHRWSHMRCPSQLRLATIVFELGPDGTPVDVKSCSLFRGKPAISCGKPCLKVAAAAA